MRLGPGLLAVLLTTAPPAHATPAPSPTRGRGASPPAPRARVRPAAGSLAFVPVSGHEVAGIARQPGASATLVNVWATWCVPCREEFPDLLRVGREYRARGLRLALVSTDFDSATARAFLAAHGVTGRTYFKVGDDMGFINALDRRWSGSLPATLVYDRAGRLVSFWEGKAGYSRIEQAVRRALAATTDPRPKETHR
jgi:thiol-disulfide isomerase/thioredoxin